MRPGTSREARKGVTRHQYVLEANWLKSSFAEKALRVPVGTNLTAREWYALATKRLVLSWAAY